MKKNLYFLSLFLSIFLFFLSFYAIMSFEKFNTDNDINMIRFLSSDKMHVRLPGTYGNTLAADYIKNHFKSHNLKPYNNDYCESFTVKTPVLNSSLPTLNIKDKNNLIIKKYEYGKDFKESFLSLNNCSFSFSASDKISIKDKYIYVTHNNSNYSLICTTSLEMRYSYIYDKSAPLSILITEELYKDIIKSLSQNYIISGNIPYSVKDSSVCNVEGIIHGFNSSLPPLIITAHFDHVGYDCNNKIYSGALDNASGTAFMLSLCNTLSSMLPPERDIVFVAFNCEEYGLLGSKNFVDKNLSKIKDAKVINFDMIGGSPCSPLTIMTNYNKNSSLYESLKNTASQKGIPLNFSSEDMSDHSSFTAKNIDAVTICDFDTSRIHTAKDTYDKINKENIERAYNLVYPEIIKCAYGSHYPFFLYNKSTLFISLLLVIFLFFIGTINKKANN